MRYHTIILLLLSLSAYANDEFRLCKPFTQIAPQRPELPPPEGDKIQLFADKAFVQEKLGKSSFSGNVLMQRADQILSTSVIVYDRNQDLVDTERDFILWDKDFVISGHKLHLRPNNKGEMTNADYWLLNRRARGHAKKIIRESKDIINLEETSYTTCAPDQEVWRLNASNITLNDTTSRGTAKHVTIRFLNIPVFYFPYLSFPITDKRQSGFLAPNFGLSDETGTEIIIPYYFNLAPHYDLVFTPRIMTRRGVLLKSEFRYLTKTSGGNLDLEYIPYDNSRRESRTSLAFKHSGQITKHWATDIDFNYVSDERYFEELGNNLSMSSITHLERRLDVSYLGNGWKGRGRIQAFQTLAQNPAANPYQRLPQLVLQTTLPQKNRQLNFSLDSEFVHFERNVNVIEGPSGNRVNLHSTVSFPWRTRASFIIPKLSLLTTHYHLEEEGESITHNRFMYRFSTDSGLFFERDLNLLNTELVQTLEPRLFYRYTPYEDQSNIPIFDTERSESSFSQLFREDDFNGIDRIDDGHQVTIALTSRLLGSKTGREHLRARIGQSYYFRDKQVTLPDEALEINDSSNIIMELSARFAKSWQATSSLQWNSHTNKTEETVFRMRYQPNSKRILNLSYRLRDDLIEQTDMSFHWLLGSHWNMLGRWNFSLPEQKTLEIFGGLEYNSCCWAVRGIARRYLNSVDGNGYLNAFFLQFQLKGLGNMGKKAETFLEDSIPGFQDHF